MKASFTHLTKMIGGKISRMVLILTVMFIWILIDAGNVYGQSERSVPQKVRSIDVNPMMREGADQGVILEESHEEGFEIKPNPTRGTMVFDFEFIIRTGDEETSVDVFDSMGRLAIHMDLDAETIETGLKLDLGQQLPGTYIVVVRNGERLFTKRILKI